MSDIAGRGPLLRRRNARKYLFISGALVGISALAYHAYNSDAYRRSKRYFSRLRLLVALQKWSEALSTGGELCSNVLRDLQQFLELGGDEIPQSLLQACKLVQSPDFASAASTTVTAVVRGLSEVAPEGSNGQLARPQQSTVDKILTALLSSRGQNLVSLAVGMGAKNMVEAYVDATARSTGRRANGQTEPDWSDKLFSFLSDPAGQLLAVKVVGAFARSGMEVYMDSSEDVNVYDDFFDSVATPAHLPAVQQCISVFARDVVATYLRSGSGGEEQAALRGGIAAAAGTAGNVAGLVEDADAPRTQAAGASSGAESLAGSPGSSVGSEAITAVPAGWMQRPDDLDSDSLLHSRRAGSVQHRAGVVKQRKAGVGQAGNAEWIAAVGSEFVKVAKYPEARECIATAVRAGTREVVDWAAPAVAGWLRTAGLVLAAFLLFLALAVLGPVLLRSSHILQAV